MNKEDICVLYNAFTKLCDYIEQETSDSCIKCPLASTVCFIDNQADIQNFARALQRIREDCGIVK